MTHRLLEKTRAAFGAPPRRIATRDHVSVPRWMKPDDPLREGYAREQELLERGDIVWGRIVQANALLFRPGHDDCPADVLFASAPPVSRERVSIASLDRAADATFALKGTKPVDHELARIAAAVTDEMTRHPPLDLPPAITQGLSMRLMTVMIHRVHLPTGVLVSRTLPLLVNEKRDIAILLPVRFWADDLCRGWLAFAGVG